MNTTTKITTEQILETARQKVEEWLTNNSDEFVYEIDDDDNETEEILYFTTIHDYKINKVELDKDNQSPDEADIAGKVFITLDWLWEREYCQSENIYVNSEEDIIFSAIVRIDDDGSLYVDPDEIERED